VATLCGCAGERGYKESTGEGEPVKKYEVTLKTFGESEPVTSQFYIVRVVNIGESKYEPEYYDILKEAVISHHLEAETTLCLRIVTRILNPAGTQFSLIYKTRFLAEEDKDNWVAKDEIVYSGNERDILRSIDCPMTIGRHETGLCVYRDGFLLFVFANFKYKVEE
jgi:hypothetical protein